MIILIIDIFIYVIWIEFQITCCCIRICIIFYSVKMSGFSAIIFSIYFFNNINIFRTMKFISTSRKPSMSRWIPFLIMYCVLYWTGGFSLMAIIGDPYLCARSMCYDFSIFTFIPTFPLSKVGKISFKIILCKCVSIITCFIFRFAINGFSIFGFSQIKVFTFNRLIIFSINKGRFQL